ncbi:hypothetical protein N8148_02780 [Gammaproteobacteria bacterium]|nr:hypothetical protein [Gammaproteobacteria bacterium]
MNEEALLKELQDVPGAVNAEEVTEDTQELPEEPQNVPEEPQAEEEQDETMEELLGTKEEEVEKKDDSVPLAKFLELKSELSEIKKAVMSKSEKADTIEALADEYDVDIDFVSRLSKNIEAKTSKAIQDKYEPIIAKQQIEQQREKTDKMFDTVYGKAIESLPDFTNVVNKDVIKKLALDDSNSKKTVKQIIKEVYGGMVEKVDGQPHPSFEKPSTGTRNPGTLDYSNLSNEDHKTIASDPKLKAEYGEWAVENLRW